MNWGVDHRERKIHTHTFLVRGSFHGKQGVSEINVYAQHPCNGWTSNLSDIFRWFIVYLYSISCFLLVFNIHVSVFSRSSFFLLSCAFVYALFKCFAVCARERALRLAYSNIIVSFEPRIIRHSTPCCMAKIVKFIWESGAKTPSRDSCVMNRYLPFELDEHFKIKSENEWTNDRISVGTFPNALIS